MAVVMTSPVNGVDRLRIVWLAVGLHVRRSMNSSSPVRTTARLKHKLANKYYGLLLRRRYFLELRPTGAYSCIIFEG